MEEQQTLDKLIQQTYDWLVAAKYSKGTVYSFKCITNQLKTYAVGKNEIYFSMDLALSFLEDHYHLSSGIRDKKPCFLRFMEMLSDFKLNNSVMIKERKREYQFPEVFLPAVEGYNKYRRSINIKEDSILRTQLYLERFFDFLEGKGCCSFEKITISVIYDFIAALSCFSKPTAAATLRAVKFFLEYSFKNGFYDMDTYKRIPCIHYNKNSTLPSVYTAEELVDLRVCDITLADTVTVKLTGKGDKSRIVPVMAPTGQLIRQYIAENHLDTALYRNHPLFTNRSGKKMTRAGITYILQKYAEQAYLSGHEDVDPKLTPHCLRHSKAMHLLQSGINLIYIRDLLGHSDVSTTEVYARADEKMKREALENAYQSPSDGEMPSWQEDNDLLNWLKNFGK